MYTKIKANEKMLKKWVAFSSSLQILTGILKCWCERFSTFCFWKVFSKKNWSELENATEEEISHFDPLQTTRREENLI